MLVGRGTVTETATVLVTVKTYPNPSDKYGETVCVAGVRLDGHAPEWVRLYPMKFRMVDYEHQFRKYEIVELSVSSHGALDPRPESMRPDQSRIRSVRVVDTSKNWAERRLLVGPLAGATTTCELVAANQAVSYSQPAPSLGLVKVHDPSILVTEGDPWNPRQQAKVVSAARPDLFNPDGFRELEPAPFRVRIHYRCGHRSCRGHEPTLIDWETGQAGRKWSREVGAERAKQMLRQKCEELLGPERDAHLFVGNQHQHRAAFLALGIWSPKVEPPSPYDGDLLNYA
jgi:hypothetical protein